ncbi:MAG: class A beta-lactamase-related serine hydrolase [Vicinamibacteria bacterium]|nr:class A beta-lactamase-related serine hydrolase [Vicinamibacteria bacterium]
MRRTCATLLLLALPIAAAPPTAKESLLWAKLEARVARVDASLDGVLGLVIKDLTSGATIVRRGDEPFPQASSIKLPVLYEAWRQADAGRLDLDAVTTPPAAPRAGGGGVLQVLGGRVSLTWHDLAVLMMGWSDNEATNLLIDRVGMQAVNARLDELGLPNTRLRRRMMDLGAAREGRENVSTPLEMARLMEVLREGRGLSPARARDLLDVAAVAKESAFRDPLPAALRVVDKPGALEGVRCVSAFVDLPGRPYVVVVMTTFLRRDADGDAAIRELSAAVFETFDRLARSSDLGRVISER